MSCSSRSSTPTDLNHVADEVPNIDGLMRGTGRVKQNGFDTEWGAGRHGPGNNVFTYFIEPDGFVAEYTTELDRIDEAAHVAQGPEVWGKDGADARRPLGTAARPRCPLAIGYSLRIFCSVSRNGMALLPTGNSADAS